MYDLGTIKAMNADPALVITAQNALDYMMQFEDGTIASPDGVKLFQYLIDTGQVWTLQGVYGRTAMTLINNGLCHR